MVTVGLLKPRVSSSKARKASRSESRPSRYRAVEIRCSDNACEAAKGERGKRYLSKDAPMLPLSQCDRQDRCDCRYRHYDDRRAKADRRGSGPLTAGKPAETDRRGKKTRRAEDHLDDPTIVEAQVSLDDTYYGHMRR